MYGTVICIYTHMRIGGTVVGFNIGVDAKFPALTSKYLRLIKVCFHQNMNKNSELLSLLVN